MNAQILATVFTARPEKDPSDSLTNSLKIQYTKFLLFICQYLAYLFKSYCRVADILLVSTEAILSQQEAFGKKRIQAFNSAVVEFLIEYANLAESNAKLLIE